jgi:hypothetical protein
MTSTSSSNASPAEVGKWSDDLHGYGARRLINLGDIVVPSRGLRERHSVAKRQLRLIAVLLLLGLGSFATDPADL